MADNHVGGSHVLPDTNGEPPSAEEHDDTEDTVEFRLMMAYAQQRWPQDTRLVARGNERPGGTPSPAPPSVEETETKKKKKNKGIKKRLLQVFPCVGAKEVAEAPESGQDDVVMLRSGGAKGSEEEAQASEGVDELATTLIKLANVSFTPPEIETDSEDDGMEQLVGLLLRTCGDELQKNHDCGQLFRDVVRNYGLFNTLMSSIFRKMGFAPSDAGDQGPKDSKTKIAVTCEVASRLSAVDTHPMTRVLGFGARYLKENYSVGGALNAAEEEEEKDSEVE